jgi:hypothetical protein
VLAFLFLIVAYVEFCDAAAVMDVYKIIQYDLGGIPFGSRRTGLNHHVGSMLFATRTDISRIVVIVPIKELNLTLIHDYLVNKHLLGGLFLLLPQKSKTCECFRDVVVTIYTLLSMIFHHATNDLTTDSNHLHIGLQSPQHTHISLPSTNKSIHTVMQIDLGIIKTLILSYLIIVVL